MTWLVFVLCITLAGSLYVGNRSQNLLDDTLAELHAACDRVDELTEALELSVLSDIEHQRVWRLAFGHAMLDDQDAALAVLGDWLDTK